ncbi:MAG: transposase, partial [Candidatus Binatia bacterium]
CPDYEERQLACKHVIAVEIVVRRETSPDGTVTETRAARVTYSQNWPAYNAAQTTEKEAFCKLLRDLCSNIPSPEPGRGRPRLPLADMIFSAAFKVYSTVSARRFMTDLREATAAGLIARTPCYNSIFNVIEDETVTPILYSLIEASAAPLAAVEEKFAVDSTGFGTSQHFRYYSEKYGKEVTGRDWLKCHAMVGVKTNIVTACKVTSRDYGDSPQLRELVRKTGERFTMKEISADKAYLARDNQTLIVKAGAEPLIPFKSTSLPHPQTPLWNKLFHYFSMNRLEFLKRYHLRSNVEATFSAIKRVFGDSVRSKTRPAQINEVLLKVLAHNIRMLIHAMHDLGITAELGCPKSPVSAQEIVLC